MALSLVKDQWISIIGQYELFKVEMIMTEISDVTNNKK